MLEPAVVSQKHKTLGVVIQAPGGVYARLTDKRGERCPSLIISKLTERVERFIEQNEGCHDRSLPEPVPHGCS